MTRHLTGPHLLSARLIAGFLGCWLLIGILVPAQSPGGPPEVAPSVRAWLDQASGDERLAVWVFFTDKGGGTADQIEVKVRQVASMFDPEAVERRLRARPVQPFDQSDLPLHKPYVDAVKAEGVTFRSFSKWLNAVSIEADPGQIERIAALPFVKSVRRVSGRAGGPRVAVSDASSREAGALYQYGYAWTQLNQIQIPDLHNEGYTGDGVKVAILDTGFWLDHETFGNLNLVAQHDFINDDDITENETGDPSGQHNHGTYCLSLLAGQTPGRMMGAAFDASYILAKTEDISDEQPIEEDWWIEAAEWADSLGAQVISTSLGYTDWYTYADMDGDTAPITNAADQAALNGIVVVAAAGNQGADPWTYVGAPGDGDSVVTAGGVDSAGVRCYFSSQGPTYDGRIKPTVMAMGQADYIATTSATNTYGRGSGTSFATPLIAGAMALLLEKHPNWLPGNVIEAITSTATMSSSPDTLYGWGILQAHDASNFVPASVASRDPGSLALRAYPNPCRAGFTLSLSDAAGGSFGGGRVAIYDVEGRLLDLVVLPPSPSASISIPELPAAAPGVVFVRVPGYGGAKVLIVR
jgi:serine protease AprX